MSSQATLSAFTANQVPETGQLDLSSFNGDGTISRKTVPCYKNPHWLQKQHWVNDRGIRDIASETTVGPDEILRWMWEFGIGCRAKYTSEDCITALQEFTDTFGQSPTRLEYKEHYDQSRPSEATIRRICGSWNDAKRAAGLDIRQEDWTQKQCLTALKRVADEIGKSPTTAEYEEARRETEPAWSAFNYNCGSWNEAKELVGIPPIQKQNTEEECMTALTAVAKQVDTVLTAATYNNNRSHEHPSRQTLQEKFGSWNEAKRMANLAVRENGDGDAIAYPYGSTWQTTRATILDRDHHECVYCSMTTQEHYNEYGRDLDVHHICKVRGFFNDFSDHELDKLDDHDAPPELQQRVEQRIAWANHSSNLITLCRSCHAEIEQLPIEKQISTLSVKEPFTQSGFNTDYALLTHE